MDFITKIFHKIGRVRFIPDETPENPVIVRHYVLFKERTTIDRQDGSYKQKAEPKKRSFNIVLHKICQSDPADLHDHPYDYFTIILWGGYWEETDKGIYWRGPGYFSFRRAEDYHRLIVKKPCWTLFTHFKCRRPWGFLFKNKWMDHKEYIKAGLNVPWKSVK